MYSKNIFWDWVGISSLPPGWSSKISEIWVPSLKYSPLPIKKCASPLGKIFLKFVPLPLNPGEEHTMLYHRTQSQCYSFDIRLKLIVKVLRFVQLGWWKVWFSFQIHLKKWHVVEMFSFQHVQGRVRGQKWSELSGCLCGMWKLKTEREISWGNLEKCINERKGTFGQVSK